MNIVVLFILSVTISLFVNACGNNSNDSLESSYEPLFVKPFKGNYYNNWPFDHDKPVGYNNRDLNNSGNRGVLTWRGSVVNLNWGNGQGHNGYDWGTTEGTPLYAVADGNVSYAGLDLPYPCGSKGEVSAIVVYLRHKDSHGNIYESRYAHLSDVIVSQDESVHSGELIGYSGSTGCTSSPHLHFAVKRLLDNGTWVYIDPFGWDGNFTDPWEMDERGAKSVWLWKTGQAPVGDYSF